MATHFSYTAPEMTEEEMAKERQELSEAEKSKAYDDVYGRKSKLELEIEQNPDRLAELMSKMEEFLEAIPDKDKRSLLKAKEKCPELVPEYYHKFLHADTYDPKKAAQRIVNFWDFKEWIFGPEKAFQKIRLSDLSDSDFGTARNKGWYALPILDKAGRQIIYTEKLRWSYKDRREFFRWVWYTVEATLEEDHQGFVIVAKDDGLFQLKNFDRKLEVKAFHFGNNCFPGRIVALHLCYDNSFWADILFPVYLFLAGKEIRLRLNVYPGSEKEERLKKLESFGITEEMLPERMGGTLKFDLDVWIEERRASEL